MLRRASANGLAKTLATPVTLPSSMMSKGQWYKVGDAANLSMAPSFPSGSELETEKEKRYSCVCRHMCVGRMIGAKLIIVRDGVIKVHKLATTAVYTDVDGSQPLGGARALDFLRTKQPNYTGNYDPNVRARLASNVEDQAAMNACGIVAKLLHLPGETALVKGHLGTLNPKPPTRLNPKAQT